MNIENSSALTPAGTRPSRDLISLGNIALAIGCALLALPTMYQVATETWSTEQGGHGPLVLATGIWALWRELKGKHIKRRPGSGLITGLLLAFTLGLFIVTRIAGILELEGFLMYGALITGAYFLFGPAIIRAIWFPLVYLAFAFPPPATVVAVITQPIKIAISSWTVALLNLLGYPVASSGVTIQIGQYQLLVAAACAGLNSIVTLTALCLFYVYLRHRSNLVALLVIALAAIPVAVISNFIRVVALVLVTYYLGDAAAQGFLHDFAGLLMFAVALLSIFAVDQIVTPLFINKRKKARA